MAQLIHDSGVRCTFHSTHCIIQGEGSDKILGIGKMMKNMYFIEGIVENYFCNLFDPRRLTLKQWHIFLGHPSLTTMKHMGGITEKFTEEMVRELEQCEVCFKAKQCREPFSVLNRRTDSLFDLVHVDLWGSYATENLCSTKYMLTIVEDYSRVTWTYLLDSKEKIYEVFHTYIKMVQTQFGRTLKMVRSDHGSEFMNYRFKRMLDSFGILVQNSCVYTPQQNGIVERKHRTLLDSARALMFQAELPDKFWPYSLMTATWMINRLPSRILDWKTPYEVLFGTPPDMSILRPFGCLAYAANVSPRKRKFDSRSHRCAFLGYDITHKGFLLYDLNTHRIFTSRDVKFFPDTYPFSDVVGAAQQP